MGTIASQLSATPVLVAMQLENNATDWNWRPPAALDRRHADRLLERVAADLDNIIGGLSRYGLVLPAALYDATELLQPGLAKFEALMELYRVSMPRLTGQPGLIAIGSRNGEFPIPSLAPRRAKGAGPLLAIPFVVLGAPEEIESLRQYLDRLLLERGETSDATKAFLEQRFKVTIRKSAYATLGHLSSLLKTHLRDAGFEELWQILESTLFHPEQASRIVLGAGNVFILENDTIYSPFYTVNDWHNGLLPPGVHAGLDGYQEWLTLQRQYSAALTAHGFRMCAVRPDMALTAACIETAQGFARTHTIGDATRLTETLTESSSLDGASIIALTEHCLADLGPIAYSILIQSHTGDLLFFANEYPLIQSAIPRIIEYWKATAHRYGAGFDISRPGFVNFSKEDGILMPFLDMA